MSLRSIWSLLLLTAAVCFTGCSDKTCTPSDGDNTTPGSALECAAGEVCYLGRCIETCTPGARCTTDDQCDDLRPFCVGRACSACGAGIACVPTLNICQPVSEVIPPEARDRPPQPPGTPRALDAGFTPGGIVRPARDAGIVEQPEDREVTRAVLVDLGIRTDYGISPPTTQGVADVRSFNTALGAGNGLKWRVDTEPPKVEIAFGEPGEDPTAPPVPRDGDCELRRLATVAGPGGASPTPIEIGEIRLTNPTDFPNSITPELIARFDDTLNRYIAIPSPVEPDFLTYSVSDPVEPHFVFVSGTAVTGVILRTWPETSDFGHHVPFELMPTEATEAALQAGFDVANPATTDLVFRYQRIESGNDGFEAVFVRIEGQQTELFCEQREGPTSGGELRVRAPLLSSFREAEGLTGPQTYNLVFERASRELLQPASTEDQLVLVTVRIRHSLRSPITFQ